MFLISNLLNEIIIHTTKGRILKFISKYKLYEILFYSS